MSECFECGHDIDDGDFEYECPYCGRDDYGEGYIICENCGALNTPNGDAWECPWCANEGETMEIERRYCECPSCGALMDEDDMCCEECGWPDVNQGWLGEEYGD